jgi:hypothetical protein
MICEAGDISKADKDWIEEIKNSRPDFYLEAKKIARDTFHDTSDCGIYRALYAMFH